MEPCCNTEVMMPFNDEGQFGNHCDQELSHGLKKERVKAVRTGAADDHRSAKYGVSSEV